jgi:hypothetical protein
MRLNTVRCFNLALARHFWGHEATTYIEQVGGDAVIEILGFFTLYDTEYSTEYNTL